MASHVPITLLYPRPRPVTLAGRTFLVGEMRIADLIDLQDFLDRRHQCPLEVLRPRIVGLPEPERMEVLRGVWKAVEKGPPRYGTPEASAILDSVEGIAESFRLVLRTHHPEMTLAQVREVAESTTPDEYEAMVRAWRRVEPIDELAWLLGMEEGEKGSPIGWAQAVCETCEHFGWTLAYVETLSVSQFRTARAMGKPRDRGMKVAPGGVKEALRKMKAKMFGGQKGGSDGG